jgi:hypothetical protein
VTNAELSSPSTVASVLAAAANGGPPPGGGAREASAFARVDAPGAATGDAASAADRGRDDEISARLVADTRAPVVPPRPEPFMPRRRPDFPEDAPRAAVGMGSVVGAAAVATDPARAPESMAAPEGRVHIERDPSVNKSLLLRLIAGVRGL